MMFVTVGHQMPFDRLIRLVDEWVAQTGRTDVFGQIGAARYKPRHFPFASFLGPAEFDSHVQECSAVVGHAGTGTIISALYCGKPMLVLPRLSRLRETRNDHQLATAARFAETKQVMVAANETDFVRRLSLVEYFRPRRLVGLDASTTLLCEIERFVRAPS